MRTAHAERDDEPFGCDDDVEQLVAQVGVGPVQRAGPRQQVGRGERAAVDLDRVGVEGAERGDARGVVGGRVTPDGHQAVDESGVGDGHGAPPRRFVPASPDLRPRAPVAPTR